MLLGAHGPDLACRARSRCRAAPSEPRSVSTARPTTACTASSPARTDSWPIRSIPPMPAELACASPKIRNAYDTLVPLAADTPWSQALGPTHLAWIFQDAPPDKPAAADLARCLVPVPHQSGNLELGRPRRRRQDGVLSLRGGVCLHATMNRTTWPTSCCPSAPTWKAPNCCVSAAPNTSSSSGAIRASLLRQPVVGGQGEARDFTDIATEPCGADRSSGNLQHQDQQGRHGCKAHR